MSASEIFAAAFLGPFVIWLVARLITAAYFKSKQHYEQRKNHGHKAGY